MATPSGVVVLVNAEVMCLPLGPILHLLRGGAPLHCVWLSSSKFGRNVSGSGRRRWFLSLGCWQKQMGWKDSLKWSPSLF